VNGYTTYGALPYFRPCFRPRLGFLLRPPPPPLGMFLDFDSCFDWYARGGLLVGAVCTRSFFSKPLISAARSFGVFHSPKGLPQFEHTIRMVAAIASCGGALHSLHMNTTLPSFGCSP
jgi:hypothetical protein